MTSFTSLNLVLKYVLLSLFAVGYWLLVPVLLVARMVRTRTAGKDEESGSYWRQVKQQREK